MSSERLPITPDTFLSEKPFIEVTPDCSRLAGGVYLYRLVAGNMTATKKMVLLK